MDLTGRWTPREEARGMNAVRFHVVPPKGQSSPVPALPLDTAAEAAAAANLAWQEHRKEATRLRPFTLAEAQRAVADGHVANGNVLIVDVRGPAYAMVVDGQLQLMEAMALLAGIPGLSGFSFTVTAPPVVLPPGTLIALVECDAQPP